jgi:hypothetical protein
MLYLPDIIHTRSEYEFPVPSKQRTRVLAWLTAVSELLVEDVEADCAWADMAGERGRDRFAIHATHHGPHIEELLSTSLHEHVGVEANPDSCRTSRRGRGTGDFHPESSEHQLVACVYAQL